eukprot:CCRYP_002152-RA/>CCRYP_002152-RA protein AED:0.48 eAED:1.00 QI:0/0/0/1/0/0/2/0/81
MRLIATKTRRQDVAMPPHSSISSINSSSPSSSSISPGFSFSKTYPPPTSSTVPYPPSPPAWQLPTVPKHTRIAATTSDTHP